MPRFLPRFKALRAKHRDGVVTYDDIITLVTDAYNQGHWDGAHSNDPRVTKRTRPQGLARYLEKASSKLK